MNENSGETPNPLNSGGTMPTANPTPTPSPVATPTPTAATTPATAPAPSPVQTTQVESLDPDGRPMEKVEETGTTSGEPKKKTGLIVGIIIAAVVLIGGIVAAVMLLPNLNKGDAVATAMQKLMNGQAPGNVAIDGSINILVNQEGTPIKRVNVALDSDIIVGSLINTSSAVLTFTTYDDKDYSVNFDEVYAANGDLYFKVEGATAALEDSKLLNLLMNNEVNEVVDCDGEETDCVVEETVETTTETTVEDPTSGIIDVFEVVDGVWLKISVDEISEASKSFTSGESAISCITDMVSDLNKNSNSAAELYNKYPFVASSTENVKVPAKNGPVYLIEIDSKNFTNYVNSINNSEITSNLYSCMGAENNVSLNEEDVAELLAEMPKVYAEVNGNYDFTRLYLEMDISDGMASATIDLGFSYPQNVNASEPVEYTDFSEVIQQIMSGLFEMPNTQPSVIEVDD